LQLKASGPIDIPVTGTALPQRVQRFLMMHIDSIEKLEVLLLLRNRAERQWTASEVALELRITEASAAVRLADLASSGLLVSNEEAPAAYRYSPAHSDDVRSISELATTYSERRVSVITFVFSKPQERVRGFAEAFLLRKRGDDHG
jgi:predicted ArsR family transcriptional regulator